MVFFSLFSLRERVGPTVSVISSVQLRTSSSLLHQLSNRDMEFLIHIV